MSANRDAFRARMKKRVPSCNDAVWQPLPKLLGASDWMKVYAFCTCGHPKRGCALTGWNIVDCLLISSTYFLQLFDECHLSTASTLRLLQYLERVRKDRPWLSSFNQHACESTPSDAIAVSVRCEGRPEGSRPPKDYLVLPSTTWGQLAGRLQDIHHNELAYGLAFQPLTPQNTALIASSAPDERVVRVLWRPGSPTLDAAVDYDTPASSPEVAAFDDTSLVPESEALLPAAAHLSSARKRAFD
eukprot:TRINITY_DN4077_c0_g1_i1.p1 TRINITY_DN4077_c0_g1~~TRINITY_DN4077_c0_g1_i1.p1  ORF type:complete len:267 (+),score=14.69 TRINITY_DN4077_c0_g1_i1:70-801(+)